jgi:hypothetical protein
MTRYDKAQFEPPAPIAQVSLRNPDTRSTISDVPMLLDTGADVSLVPAATLESLELAASEDILYELLSFDGKISFAPVVQLELVFCNRIFRGQYLANTELSFYICVICGLRGLLYSQNPQTITF